MDHKPSQCPLANREGNMLPARHRRALVVSNPMVGVHQANQATGAQLHSHQSHFTLQRPRSSMYTCTQFLQVLPKSHNHNVCFFLGLKSYFLSSTLSYVKVKIKTKNKILHDDWYAKDVFSSKAIHVVHLNLTFLFTLMKSTNSITTFVEWVNFRKCLSVYDN